MKRVTAAAFGLFALSCLISDAASAAPGPVGTWLSEDGGLRVRISTCGGNRLCGTVVWLGEPIDRTTGRPKTDKHNPDPAKRARPLIGLRVAQGLAPSGPNEWSGMIYNADDGHMYQGHIKLNDVSTMRLQGCVLSVLCKSRVWTRSGSHLASE
jgi:uncharacterized protein (DUF2147 family)